MANITIVISDEAMERLRTITFQALVEPDVLVGTALEEWLDQRQRDFAAAMEVVLSKNAELYRRRAQ